MAIKLSTGIRNHLCVTGSLRSAVNGMILNLYSGTVPSGADSAISGDSTLLCTISVDDTGTGLSFEDTSAVGALVKETTETWEGTVLANGTATYYRLATTGDDGTLSTTALRVQGSVGNVSGDMLLSSTSLVAGAVQSLGYYALTFPTQ